MSVTVQALPVGQDGGVAAPNLRRKMTNFIGGMISRLFERKNMPTELTTVTEQIRSASIPDLVLGLGMAVAKANAALAKEKTGVIYTIPEADIELSVALSLKKSTEVGIQGGGNIYAFNVSASYASTFGFAAEGSSKIRIKLRAMPPAEEPPAVAPGT